MNHGNILARSFYTARMHRLKGAVVFESHDSHSQHTRLFRAVETACGKIEFGAALREGNLEEAHRPCPDCLELEANA